MKKEDISLSLNITIVILVSLATIFMLTGFQFMAKQDALTATKIETFKFFTVDSNVLMGIVAFIFAKYEIDILKGRIKAIPTRVYILKLVATVGVILTFLVTAFFLAPTALNGYLSLFLNSNLFFHLIIPILSFITFVFFESNNKIDFKYSFMGLIPVLLYSLFYAINCFSHIENGIVSHKYDWYGFLIGGIKSTIPALMIILVTTYFICFSLWSLNRRTYNIRQEN